MKRRALLGLTAVFLLAGCVVSRGPIVSVTEHDGDCVIVIATSEPGKYRVKTVDIDLCDQYEVGDYFQPEGTEE